jgi:hypothetical protein
MNLKNNRGIATIAAILLGAGILLIFNQLQEIRILWFFIKTTAPQIFR